MKTVWLGVLGALATAASAAPMDFAAREKIAESADRNYVFVNAHRGAGDPAKRIPENSLAAIRHAIELGCDIVEVDPKTTRDGRVILSHDNNRLDREMAFPCPVDGQSQVADIPYEGAAGELCFKNARLRVSRSSPDVTDERPCTWEELLDACKGKCYIQVDCTHWNCMPDWKKVWNPVVERGMERQLCFKVGPRDGSGIMPPGKAPPEGMRGYFWSSIKWKAAEAVPEAAFRERLAQDLPRNRLQTQTIGRFGHDQSGEYGDRTSIDFDVRVGWDKFLDFGATVFMTDYAEELIRHLEKRGRRVAKPDDTRRRVLPPFVANRDYTGDVVKPTLSPETGDDFTVVRAEPGVKPGVYTVTVRLKDRKTTRWADGTDGEKQVAWRIRDRPSLYKPGADFLAFLAAHPKRAESSPFAQGGDVVLRFMEAREETFLHIYTNTAAKGTFAPKQPLNGRVFAVGGGGGAGSSGKQGAWTFFCADGGAGGAVVDRPDVKLAKPLAITVGAGGAGAAKGDGAAGGESRVESAGGKALVAKGGAGGKAARSAKENTYGRGGDGAAAKGVTNPFAKGALPSGGRGCASDILGETLEFGGGGAAATHSVNGLAVFELAGGAGGGGRSVSASYDDKKYFSEAGRDGLGGGGAGGHMKGTKASFKGEDGGTGLVIIAYTVR